ncbi:putative ferulic acid Esterase/Feruloyl esterase [Xylariaceae sp. FL0804]|nr:putative ferulic acid Esterase/Feruloyl esterase [Xylariaceae sp. FL0804]
MAPPATTTAALLAGLLSALAPRALAFACTSAAFQAQLPSNATVAYARQVPANGTFDVPAGDIAYPTSPTGLPALCAVQVNVTSSASSAFSFGLFLPTTAANTSVGATTGWNGRFLAVGNGGFAGGINWLDMGAGAGYGFAAMSTDTGHNSTAADLSWGYEQPQKQIDFGWRAMHGSVELAKDLVAAYYGSDAAYSYYSGCSTGGRQGLKEVEMFPDDFDGALVGAPAWWTTHLQTWTIKVARYNLPETADYHIPNDLFTVVGQEVLKQCDPQDGLVDNIISDPQGCNFYPEALLCAGGNTTDCLTAAQVGTLYNIYHDYVDVNQTLVFPHLQMGSEAQWTVLLGLGAPGNPLGYEYAQYFLGLGPDWDYADFDYSVVELADATDPGDCNADDFDLSPFRERGGKLLHYHGLADGLIATGSSEYFYKQVLRNMSASATASATGPELDDFYRFFLVPGMQHCTGTPTDVAAPWYFAGANQAGSLGTGVHSVPGYEDADHDALLALMKWTENGTAPEQIIATRYTNDSVDAGVQRQRPLCLYPKQARYLGSGDADDAASWECASIYDTSATYAGFRI